MKRQHEQPPIMVQRSEQDLYRFLDIRKYLFQGAILLDVRTVQEYIRTKLPKARHAPLEQFSALVQSIKDWQKPIIVYSTDGRRSAQAVQQLRFAGIEAMDGGSRSNLAIILSYYDDTRTE